MENQNLSPVSQIEQKEISPIGNLLSNAFDLYKKGFKKIIGMLLLMLAGVVPFSAIIILFFILNRTLKDSGQLLYKLNIILGIAGLISFIAAVYVSINVQIGFFLIVKDIFSSKNIKEFFADARKYFWKYIFVVIIQFVFVFLWTLLFIIPGIIFSVYYTFSLFVLFFEGREGTSALRRSKELVKGYWWAVVGRLFAGALIIFGIILIISIPLVFMEDGSISYGVYNMFVSIMQSFIGTFFLIYQYLVYKDLVRIKGEVVK